MSRLRQLGFWGPARRVHGAICPPVCAAMHASIRALPDAVVPAQIALKHEYDHRHISITPGAVGWYIPVGNWRVGRSAAEGDASRLGELRRWWTHGGAWKNVKRHPSRSFQGHFVLDGNWDTGARPFSIHPTVRELFVEGLPAAHTSEYRRMLERIERGDFRFTKGMRTVDDLDRYFGTLVAAYEAIRDSGYRTQEELGLEGGDEIRVCVDRHGRWCVFGGGTHRLSIARVLGVEVVPVQVKRVHAQWIGGCLEQYGGSLRPAVAAGLSALASRTAPLPGNALTERSSVRGGTC